MGSREMLGGSGDASFPGDPGAVTGAVLMLEGVLLEGPLTTK